jgi:hypothetical protein
VAIHGRVHDRHHDFEEPLVTASDLQARSSAPDVPCPIDIERLFWERRFDDGTDTAVWLAPIDDALLGDLVPPAPASDLPVASGLPSLEWRPAHDPAEPPYVSWRAPSVDEATISRV